MMEESGLGQGCNGRPRRTEGFWCELWLKATASLKTVSDEMSVVIICISLYIGFVRSSDRQQNTHTSIVDG